MNSESKQPTADTRPDVFHGYQPPKSNTTYCPNQFFDVVLPNSSRGCARIVAYMVRRTLGWCDADGNPQESTVVLPYWDIIQDAGVSREMVRSALDEAEAAGYITCVREPKAKTLGEDSISALYELRWDEGGAYTTKPHEFRGFFAGEGNRTYIPNAFFDHTVKTEPLSVIKVVGAIIRHTIGFQNKHGFRRQQKSLSFAHIQRLTKIASQDTVNKALQTAMEHSHIIRIKEGYFDPDAGLASEAAVYGLRWQDIMGEKIAKVDGTDRKESNDRSENRSGIGQKIVAGDRSENRSGQLVPIGQKNVAGSVRKSKRDRSENRSGIEIKQQIKLLNKTAAASTSSTSTPTETQQVQTPVAAAAFDRLIAEGFDEEAAKHLCSQFPEERIIRQCELLPRRKATQNRLGLLRKAIEGDWPAPQGKPSSSPAASPSSNPSSATSPSPSPSLRPELHVFKATPKGYVPGEKPLTRQDVEELYQREKELKSNSPEVYQRFLDEQLATRRKIEQMPMVGEVTIKAALKVFDSEPRRLVRLRSFLEKVGKEGQHGRGMAKAA